MIRLIVGLKANSAHGGAPTTLEGRDGPPIELVPQGVTSPDGSIVWYSANVDDATDVEALVDGLLALDQVEAAYPQPPTPTPT